MKTGLPTDGTQHFNGPDYFPKLDQRRLTGQLLRIWDVMIDGEWRTLHEIHRITGDPESSISAQLRHLRKPRFGKHKIDKRRRGNHSDGLFEYKLIANYDFDELKEQEQLPL